MVSNTPRLNYIKPGDGDSGWGTAINTNMDAVDIHVGTQHKSDGTHGPRVSILQNHTGTASGVALDVGQSGNSIAVRVNQSGAAPGIMVYQLVDDWTGVQINKSATGAGAPLVINNSGNASSIYISGGNPAIYTTETGNNPVITVNKTHTGNASIIQILGASTASIGKDINSTYWNIETQGTMNSRGVVISNRVGYGLSVTGSGGATSYPIYINNVAPATGIYLVQSGLSYGIYVDQSANSTALYLNKVNTGNAVAFQVQNSGTGSAVLINNQEESIALQINQNKVNGAQAAIRIDTAATGQNAIYIPSCKSGINVTTDKTGGYGLYLNQAGDNIEPNTDGVLQVNKTATGTSRLATFRNYGTGDGLYVLQYGAGTGINITHSANARAMLVVAATGTHSVTLPCVEIRTDHTAAIGQTVLISNKGFSNKAVTVNNSSNASSAIEVNNSGATGAGVTVNQYSNRPAVYVYKDTGSQNCVEISNNGTGYDIYGHSGNWFAQKDGAIKIGVMASASRPGSPAQGTIIYDTTVGELCLYDGSAWVKLVKSAT